MAATIKQCRTRQTYVALTVASVMTVASVLMGASMGARAQTSDAPACGLAYHAALAALASVRGEALAGAVTTLRAPDATLPGRWLYAQALFAKPGAKRAVEPERPCLEKIRVSGRVRCVRYDEAAPQPLPAELTISPAPTGEELRVLKALNDLVDGRGAIPEFGANGRFTWLAQRATGDLKTYISQPAHPALCAGGTDVANFYAGALRPLQKRIDDVADLSRKAHALADARVAELMALGKSDDPASPSPSSSPSSAPSPPAMPKLLAALGEVLGRALPPGSEIDITNETAVLAALQKAKPALIAAQVAARSNPDTKSVDRILAAGRAVRMIEAAAYSALYEDRYRRFAAAVLTVPDEIQKAHAKSCTCGN